MMSKRESRWALLWAVVIVGLTCLPYLVAWQLAPAGTQFTGLLVNPSDGETYYAKMQQGARGDWLFHLPFTPEPHRGVFVYTFYLALGHLAAALTLPIPLAYHLARVAADLFFLLVAYRFITRFFEKVQTRRVAFLLMGFSAGFGWMLGPFGVQVPDLWVAEGFTFLSMLINPHFPLAMGLMLLIFLSVLDAPSFFPFPRTAGAERGRFPLFRLLRTAACGLLLALVQPFSVLVVSVVLATYLGILALRNRRLPWSGILVAGAAWAGTAPVMVYDLYVYRFDPIMAIWTSQDLTPSPPLWQSAAGYGLILLLALVGIGLALRRDSRRLTDLFLLAWVGSILVFLYVPFAQQRRFITGLHVPLTLLATIALEQVLWPRIRPRLRAPLTGLLIGCTALTNLFVPLIAVAGVAQGRSPLVMSHAEAAACAWLGEHTAWTDTVLAPPDSGQFIPAWAGNRVVYGHPVETIDAKTKEAETAHFFSPQATAAERSSLLHRYGVRYVLSYPLQGDLDATTGLTTIWSGDNAALYRVEGAP